MSTIKVELDVPKESKEVVDLLVKVFDLAKAKTPTAGYSVLLGDLMTAIDGATLIKEEVKSEFRDDLAGYIVKVLVDKLMSSKAPVAPKPAV